MGTMYEVDQSTGAVGDPVIGDGPIIGGNAIITKIWENPDPTQSFAAQNVSMNVDDYDMFFTSLTYSTSHVEICLNYVAVKDLTSRMATVTESTGLSSFRDILFDSANDRMTVSATNGAKSGDNTRLIPYKVYGIKLKEV